MKGLHHIGRVGLGRLLFAADCGTVAGKGHAQTVEITAGGRAPHLTLLRSVNGMSTVDHHCNLLFRRPFSSPPKERRRVTSSNGLLRGVVPASVEK